MNRYSDILLVLISLGSFLVFVFSYFFSGKDSRKSLRITLVTFLIWIGIGLFSAILSVGLGEMAIVIFWMLFLFVGFKSLHFIMGKSPQNIYSESYRNLEQDNSN